MKTLSNISVTKENGFFKVPADFHEGFTLVPEPGGKLNLVFWSRHRMKRYLRQYGFVPADLRPRQYK